MDAETDFEAGLAAYREGDLAEARTLFGRAGEAGKQQGAVFHCYLTANRFDWDEGLALLRRIAPNRADCARQLALIEAMTDTVPPGEVLSETPQVTLFRNLFTPAECTYLAEAARPMMARSTIISNGRQIPDPMRNSDSAAFPLLIENPAVHALNQRIAAASGTDATQGEPLQILRYRRGGEYRPHFDAIPGLANQRILTMLVWLNTGFEGGETQFPKVGLTLKGEPGDALLFRNTLPDGSRDPATIHAGLPVTAGEKLIASRWIRERAL
ncbi:MAG: prolyl hydroxylase family protein [Sphingomonas sp.]